MLAHSMGQGREKPSRLDSLQAACVLTNKAIVELVRLVHHRCDGFQILENVFRVGGWGLVKENAIQLEARALAWPCGVRRYFGNCIAKALLRPVGRDIAQRADVFVRSQSWDLAGVVCVDDRKDSRSLLPTVGQKPGALHDV